MLLPQGSPQKENGIDIGSLSVEDSTELQFDSQFNLKVNHSGPITEQVPSSSNFSQLLINLGF